MITVISLRNLRYFWRKVKSYFVGNYYNKTVMNLKIQEILEDANNKLARANSFTTLKVAEERQRAISDLQAVVTDIESSFENVDAAIAAERERIGQAEGDITIMKSNWDNINATIDTEVITQLQTTGSQITNAVGILIDGRVPSITATVLQEVEEELDGAISRNQTITQLVLDVSGIGGKVGTLETTAAGLNTRVGVLELSSSRFSTRISAMEGVLTDGGALINVKTKFSTIEQNVDSISQIVSNGDNYAAIVTRINESTGTGEVIIDAEHIELTGTAIADALITNKLTSSHIDASTLSIGAAQITGRLTASQIDLSGATFSYSQITDPPTIPSEETIGQIIEDYLEEHPITAGDTVTVSDVYNTSTGITTRTINITHNSITTSHTEYWAEDYVLTDIGLGVNDGNHPYFKVESDGLLTAKNAVIYGAIYANSGYFSNLYIDGQIVYAGGTGITGYNNSNFYIDANGYIHAKGAILGTGSSIVGYSNTTAMNSAISTAAANAIASAVATSEGYTDSQIGSLNIPSSIHDFSDFETGTTNIINGVVDTDYVNALGIIAAQVSANWVYAGNIAASQITSGTISADRIDTNTLITAQLIVDKLEAAQATIDDLTLTHAHFSSDNSVDAYLNIENGQILLGTSNVFSNSRILIKQNNIELYLSNTSRKYNTELDRQYIYIDNWDEYGNNGRITVLPDRIGFSTHNTVFEKTSRITDTGIKGYISFDNNHNLKINENYSIQSDAVNKVWKGTLVEYNAISAKDDNTLYLITS